jgi:hypothetical protein
MVNFHHIKKCFSFHKKIVTYDHIDEKYGVYKMKRRYLTFREAAKFINMSHVTQEILEQWAQERTPFGSCLGARERNGKKRVSTEVLHEIRQRLKRVAQVQGQIDKRSTQDQAKVRTAAVPQV